MEKIHTDECPCCGKMFGVTYDEVDEVESLERFEVYFANHVINCGRTPCKES